MKPEDVENLWDTCAGPRATVTERRHAFADAIESRVRAETLHWVAEQMRVHGGAVEEFAGSSQAELWGYLLKLYAVDAAVKEGGGG